MDGGNNVTVVGAKTIKNMEGYVIVGEWRVYKSQLVGCGLDGLQKFRNEPSSTLVHMSDSFNCITHVRERFANKRVRVLQASRDVSAMATRGMTFLHTDENITLTSNLSCWYHCR